MTTLDLTKRPDLPRDANTYQRLNGHARLELRVALASESRLGLNPVIASLALAMATVSLVVGFWANETTTRSVLMSVMLWIAFAGVLALNAFTLYFSVRNPARRRRAWRERPAPVRWCQRCSAWTSTSGTTSPRSLSPRCG